MRDVNKIWVDDKLERQICATFLTNYLNELYKEQVDEAINRDSFVMNINAEWGFGKTFFINNWAEELREKGHPVVVFDAWTNDFSENPLIGFFSEIEEAITKYKSKVPIAPRIYNAVVESGKKAISPAFGELLNITASIATYGLVNNLTNLQSKTVIDEAIKSHREKKDSIKEFKKCLFGLVEFLNNSGKAKMPMYIFIDELDRCRPNYAIELLEGVKHIFGVKGLFFIISTNKNQLAHSISATYGNGFDSITYLRRFFDQEYALPRPNNESFSLHLMDKYRIVNNQNLISPVSELSIDKIFSLFATSFKLSLRDQDQIAGQLKAIILSNADHKLQIFYLLFLMMYKIKSEDSFVKFFKLQGISAITDHIQDIFDVNTTVEGFGNTEDGSQKFANIKVIEIITRYRLYSEKTLGDLYDQASASGTLGQVRALLVHYSTGSTRSKHTISKYPELIMQAGQLN